MLLLPAAAFARPVEGQITAGREKLGGVIVTDGYGFAKTDDRGRFELNVDDRAEFIHIVTPAGYVAPFNNGAPVFYLRLDPQTKRYDFDLLRYGNGDGYAMLAVSDPQTGNDKQFERFERETVADMKQHSAELAASGRAVLGVQLGDIVWDNLPLLARNKQAMAGLGFPVYPVVGNHDYDEHKKGDEESLWAYREQFGPEYYAFDSGTDHYIILDNILYDTGRQYTVGFDQRQIDWVRGYLAHIPAGERLVVCVHCPFMLTDSDEPHFIERAEEMLELMRNHKVEILSGHTHVCSNIQIRPWAMEHNVGAACGAWWTDKSNKDGTPNGYQVLVSSPAGFSWYYKSVGRPADYQIEAYGRGVFAGHSESVVVKAWNCDEQWRATWREDGREMGEMKRFTAYDADYLQYLQRRRDDGKAEVGQYKQPVLRSFYFAATPTKDAREVEITVTDRFGNTYTKTIKL